MLDITKIKSVSMTHICFNDDTHEKMTADKATELYEITSHLMYAIPILDKMSNDTHNIPFKEYKETEGVNWMDKIDIEIYNKYARFDNERLTGCREKSREILETFIKFKRINATCKSYLNYR